MEAVGIQARITKGYAKAAQKIGLPFSVYRPTDPLNPLGAGDRLATMSASFTNARVSKFDYNKPASPDDVFWTALIDTTPLAGQTPSNVIPGDILVGATTYFVAIMDPLLPVVCVRCTRLATAYHVNAELSATGGSGAGLPSQAGSTGSYWGASRTAAVSGAGRTTYASGVPVAMVATAGRATGTAEVPGDAPGPSRWRIYLPVSCFPKGSVNDRDILADEEGNEHEVTVAAWTPLGYRVEAIRLEN